MKQHEAVIEAMKTNGGYATLGQLYQTALKIPDCKWETKSPFASIRRIVQTHPDLFFKVKPGLWALTSKRAEVLEKYDTTEKPKAKGEEYTHSFYQGLITEIGNLKRCETFIPHQDKNKPFLQRKLYEVATLRNYYDFTYERLLRKARTVDVTWFNVRRLPDSFFEVEHSTDVDRALLKFLEFQDFRIAFFIVADAARHSYFNDRFSSPTYSPLQNRVKFLDYESISELHTKLSASVLAEQILKA